MSLNPMILTHGASGTKSEGAQEWKPDQSKFMSDRMKREHVAAWDAFALRCAELPKEIKRKELKVVTKPVRRLRSIRRKI